MIGRPVRRLARATARRTFSMCSVIPGSSTAHFRKAALTSVPWIPTSMSWTKAASRWSIVAVGEMLREKRVLGAVDAGAHDQLDPGLGDHLPGDGDGPAEVHAGGVDDRPHPLLHRPPHLGDPRRPLGLGVIQMRPLLPDRLRGAFAGARAPG